MTDPTNAAAPAKPPTSERDKLLRRACLGGRTIDARIGCEWAQECWHCGRRVRDDMVDHPFFGFAASGCKQ